MGLNSKHGMFLALVRVLNVVLDIEPPLCTFLSGELQGTTHCAPSSVCSLLAMVEMRLSRLCEGLSLVELR